LQAGWRMWGAQAPAAGLSWTVTTTGTNYARRARSAYSRAIGARTFFTGLATAFFATALAILSLDLVGWAEEGPGGCIEVIRR